MKWISIKDNKPPTNVPLMFYYDYMESNHDNAPMHVRKIIIGKVLKNIHHIIGDHWQYLKLGATHWMPLPRTPDSPHTCQKKSMNDSQQMDDNENATAQKH